MLLLSWIFDLMIVFVLIEMLWFNFVFLVIIVFGVILCVGEGVEFSVWVILVNVIYGLVIIRVLFG